MRSRTRALTESASAQVLSSARAFDASGEPNELADPCPATPRQRQLMLSFCVAMVIATVSLLPFARMPWRVIPFFTPAYLTAATFSCLITAYLMYGHFTATRTVALLHLSAGYLYTAVVLSMQSLTLEDAFIENHRLLGDPESPAWLYLFWHLGPALSVFYLAWSNYRKPGLLDTPGANALRNTAIAWLAATTATVVLVFGPGDWLPVFKGAEDYSRPIARGIALALELILGAALLVLWRASRFRNVLHLRLGVVVLALLCDHTLTMVAGNRWMLGWYAGRILALLGLSVMTLVYLQELKNAYLASLATTEKLAISNARLDLEARDRSLHVEKLVQADRHKDQFLAMLAHELRNPLAPISAAAELLNLGSLSQETLQKTTGIITRQVNHMTGLVDDLLDVSRVSNGLIELSRTQVDIKQVIADAIEQVQPFVDARHHRLSAQLAPELAYVTGDHKRLVQVVANLLSNAAKYTPENGSISVRVDVIETHIEIGIADNGIGIPAQLLPDVFGLFVQGERPFARAQGGLGLGLAIVKNLIELHSGSVSAQSQGHGKGSEFTICLPRLSTPSDCWHNVEEASASTQVTAPKPFVLIVDDNVDAAVMLGEFLKSKGYKVAVEHDGHNALKRAKKEKFDAFFLDIEMPNMDGLQLVKHLRALPHSTTKLMVAVTGYGSESDRKRFSVSGFDEHLVKPVILKKILMLLENTHHS